MSNQISNKLKHETSPYLLQHADNPVNWYPWCGQALDEARREDKPIFLSIGYSACHWCHVMAHESFEDVTTAEVMNKLFVNIKVDREERPDLDKIYQLAHQMLTQRPGGWPLTLILAPYNHAPFFAGTYFPKQAKYQMPAFISILERTAEYYRQQKDAIQKHNSSFLDAIGSISQHKDTTPPEKDLFDQAQHELEHTFDPSHGGFGQAPKFPHTTNMEFLLRHWFKSGRSNSNALRMTETTLKKMVEGGIYDQLGGGFCRYSVDNYWLIPHFEKMLYDNGPLLALYCQTWQISNDPLFKKAAVETAEWVIREMQSSEGGYFSSLDADSEGQEGKFYAWNRDEIKGLLSQEEYKIVQQYYGIEQAPNFEDKWHLHIAQPLAKVSKSLDKTLSDTEQLLASARKKLFLHRENRIHPGRDDKILTSWNALMVKGMAIAARVFECEEFAGSAQKSIDFIRSTLWTGSRLLATYKDRKAHLNAYLDDYAFTIDACLELLQTRWRTIDLLWAIELAEVLLEHFEDKVNGGFFFTSDDHEKLIHRPKPMMDESMPAGNGKAAFALARLGHLIGNQTYLNASQRVLKACSASLKGIPHAHGSLLIALEEWLDPAEIIIIRGQKMEQWQQKLQQNYAPNRLCFGIPDFETELPGILNQRKPGNTTTAYVCNASACLPEFTNYESMEQALNAKTPC